LRKAILLACCVLFISADCVAGEKPRLLILGDSLAAGFGLEASTAFQAQLAARFPNITLIDAAVSGDTTAGGLARLDWALADGADAAIVELGGNDGLRGIDPKNTEANLTEILDTLKARHVPVLFSGMYAPPNLGDEYEAEFRAVFDKLGKRHELIYDSFFLEDVAGNPALNQADHIHPNPVGVQHVVNRIAPIVVKLMARVAQGGGG
jgi:acyl-CoA thioesterase-1